MEKTEFLERILKESDIELNDLTRLFQFYSNEIVDLKDKLAVFLHFLMLKSGFLNTSDQVTDKNYEIVQKKGSIYNKIEYNSVIQADKKIKQLSSKIFLMLFISTDLVGEIQIQHGTFHSSFQKVKLNRLFSSETCSRPSESVKMNLNSTQDFIVDLKNNAINQLKLHLKRSEGLDIRLHTLSDLPVELIYKICLKYLSTPSIVALMLTCRHFRDMFYSDSLDRKSFWNKLLKRDFETDLNLNDAYLTRFNNYRTYYIDLYESRKSIVPKKAQRLFY
jgi:hypothetical protein